MSDLPSDLLNIIARNLKEPTDLIRFQSVNSWWRSATSSLPMLVPPFPWFYICFIPDKLSCYFYSFSENRIYEIHLPDGWASVDYFNPSSTAWFPASKEKTEDGKYTSLLNPFTGKVVDMPDSDSRLIWSRHNLLLSKQNFEQIFPDYQYVWQFGNCCLAMHYFLTVAKSITCHDNCLFVLSLTRCAPMVIVHAVTL